MQCLISHCLGQDFAGREGRRRSRRWKTFALFKQWVPADGDRYNFSPPHDPVVFSFSSVGSPALSPPLRFANHPAVLWICCWSRRIWTILLPISIVPWCLSRHFEMRAQFLIGQPWSLSSPCAPWSLLAFFVCLFSLIAFCCLYAAPWTAVGLSQSLLSQAVKRLFIQWKKRKPKLRSAVEF